jgi:hypothetical protein
VLLLLQLDFCAVWGDNVVRVRIWGELVESLRQLIMSRDAVYGREKLVGQNGGKSFSGFQNSA